MSTPDRIVLLRSDFALAICRLDPSHTIEPWMQRGPLWSVTRTADELSVICGVDHVPADVRHEGPFAVFVVAGPLDFALVGIMSRLSAPLAEVGVPVFALSTYDTDYVLVRAEHAERARSAWTACGLVVTSK